MMRALNKVIITELEKEPGLKNDGERLSTVQEDRPDMDKECNTWIKNVRETNGKDLKIRLWNAELKVPIIIKK